MMRRREDYRRRDTTSETTFQMSKEIHDFNTRIIEHLFLPLKVSTDSSDIITIEDAILYRLSSVIDVFVNSITNDETRNKLLNLLKTFRDWKLIQFGGANPTKIMKSIRNLVPGETFALYVRCQNAGLMISIPLDEVKRNGNGTSTEHNQCEKSSETAIFSTFPASLSSNEITSNPGNIAAIFPATAICIPRTDVLYSGCFARQLGSLTCFETYVQFQKVTKAGQKTPEVREVANPSFLTHWLAGVLSNDICKPASSKQLPRVVKKIRDSVIFGSNTLPFRRSGLWMTAKVVLQISLLQNLGEKEGHFAYKLIILKLLLKFLMDSTYDLNAYPSLTIEMMGKIARRSRKLQLARNKCQRSTGQPLCPSLIQILENTFDESARQLKRIRNILKHEWMQIIDREKEMQHKEFLLRGGKPTQEHPLSESGFQEYIHTNKNILIDVVKQHHPAAIAAPRHRNENIKFPIEFFNSYKDQDIPFMLYDFETNVRYWDSVIGINDFTYVIDIFMVYLIVAKKYYANDPVGASRMIITCLKIVHVWDHLITQRVPMLLEHRPGVQLSFTKYLLIPGFKDMQLLLELETYFEERTKNAKFPSLIEEKSISTTSFMARFGATLPHLEQIRRIILKDSESDIERKYDEVRIARVKCDILLRKLKVLECEYQYTDWKRIHNKRKCPKCVLSYQYDKALVDIYERPLPANEECQYAVLNELNMPSQIACLRDILYLFGSSITLDILPDPVAHKGKPDANKTLYGPWRQYDPVAKFFTRPKDIFIVNLMSTRKLFQDSHYNQLHPMNPDSDFIKNNGYNCQLAGEGVLFTLNQNDKAVKNLCTLRVTRKTPYANLQYAINGDSVTPNEVLARQNECLTDLPHQEFVEFGSLRCFSRLQLRNIFRALTQMTLSVKHESVFNLICQCMWQVSPSADTRSEEKENQYPINGENKDLGPVELLRLAHQDLNDPIFMCSLLELMESYRAKHAHNWKDHHVLLTVIVIGCRVAELCQDEDVVNLALSLLKKCRENALSWSKEVRKILATSTKAPREEVDVLRIKMVEINICCALTFLVGDHLIERILNSESIKTWLLVIANIYDNMVLVGSGHKTIKEVGRVLSTTLQNLLRRVREIGQLLEPYLREKIAKGEYIFTSFVQEHYTASESLIGLEEAPWTCFNNESYIYRCELVSANPNEEKTTLDMDIIGGGFLVDGCPVSYLPSSIENHPLFQRTFPNKSFSVGPYPYQRGRMLSLESFLTSESNSKQYTKYSFFLQQDNTLIITEHRHTEVQQTWQLIPPYILSKNIPNILIEDFTHWWNKKTGIIEFYTRDRNSPSKLSLKHPVHRLDLTTCLLREMSSERLMVDITCVAYRKILAVLARLEYYKYINMWFDPSTGNYVVELPRMGLQFKVSNSNGVLVLTSKEYRGLKIADGSESSISTLIGLRNGLLLVDPAIKSKSKLNSILLVPHGTPIIAGNNNVRIKNDVLRTPTFFAYEVDTRLQQLKAGESQAGWAFLAYLHATTSSHLPDPFTGTSGTERAFQILQSGHCWSAHPMDPETIRTLNDIANLSPSRTYYPPQLRNMESVKWPLVGEGSELVEIPPHIAHDGFQLIIEKLINDSQRLSFLFQSSSSGESNLGNIFNFRGQRDLCSKSYWRRIGLRNELCRIYSNFDEEFDLKKAPATKRKISFSESDFDTDVMNNVLNIAQSVHNWTFRPPPKSEGLLKNLLLNGKDLQGAVILTYEDDYRLWTEMEFRDAWLSMYELARSNLNEKKELLAIWAHLLTHLAFRSNSTIKLDQLALLQTIAVNWPLFSLINPPQRQEYFMTNEHDFTYLEIVRIFKDNVTPWVTWMNRQTKEMYDYESEEDFITRMQPIYEYEVDTSSMDFADIIHTKWNVTPIQDSDDLFPERISSDKFHGIWNQTQFDKALFGVNTLLRNWFRNRQLLQFLDKVEKTVNAIQRRTLNSPPFVHTLKAWTKNSSPKDKMLLKEMCDRSRIFTIDFEDIIGEREEDKIDKVFLKESEIIFNGGSTREIRNKRVSVDGPPKRSSEGPVSQVEKFPLELSTDCPILHVYMKDLEMSWTESQKSADEEKFNVSVTDVHAETSRRALEMWEKVKGIIKPVGAEVDPVIIMLISADIFPRVTPLSLFPLICRQEFARTPGMEYLDYIRNILGAYGVLLTEDQRSARCMRYKLKGKESLDFELKAELLNPGHENWSPSKKPEWLLFELEMDLMVRPIQAKVAERMENPENGENALLQLNMGEGKTAVIIPLLILSLANGKQICRVTVLKSLLEINQKALIFRIGGLLLNRRVYTFPCRRDFKIKHPELTEMLKVYKECMKKGGVVIGLAEHRLSFKLKTYETCGAGNFADGRELLELHDWLNVNAREVLDESDEILQVKYQLIYTLGVGVPICGGTSRWTIIQKVLKIIPTCIETWDKKFGPNSIEFSVDPKHPESYPYFRLLKTDYYEYICISIVEEILSGTCGMPIPEITNDLKPILMNFITNEKICREEINNVYKLYPLQAHQEILLILRGLLACRVLCSALSKRWRVNYGVNPNGYRRMAVPFRAKDVAAERTEFGHPDIAIVLTQLSYYYSGLNEMQLEQCFGILSLQPDPSLEYQRWIDLVPKTVRGFHSIQNLSGVNLKDFFQRTKILFPALEKNIATIDFWLGAVVFPHESKQFILKIGCSPWDLCVESGSHPTTGFSGTNDSKLLLPKTIHQKDLTELQGTNGEVLRNLLRDENNQYENLPLGFTGRQILKRLVNRNIRLLLDVGALMLELNNEQVAKTWLELVGEEIGNGVEAAVYFDDDNKLVVIDRITKVPLSLETSTYRSRLDSCVIYLDDAHTRGTDLKIPTGITGCVTLGKGVTKDKLVQGCMRMRKLGKGHKVLFFASHEVHNSIKSLAINEEKTSTQKVLLWAIENSRSAIEDGFIHWAGAGVYQAQKLSSHLLYAASKKTDDDLKLLADSCSERDRMDLKTMYGEVRAMKKFPLTVQHLLKRVNRELQKRLSRCAGTSTKPNVNKIVESFGEVVIHHLKKYVPEIARLSQCLEEEQERELEHQLEAQLDKVSPPGLKSCEHFISDEVTKFVKYGTLTGVEKWGVKLPLALRNTRIWAKGPMDTWGQHIYASKEFINVVRSPPALGSVDSKRQDILRPPHWIVSVSYSPSSSNTNTNPNSDRIVVLLLISPYEANHFMPYFRYGKAMGTLHMFAGRLCPDQDTLYRNPKLTIPSGKDFQNFTSSIHSALLMFSGSSYFIEKEEQDEYCRFAGFCLKERTPVQDAVFQMGGIVNGFVDKRFLKELGYQNCRFDRNPDLIIKAIITLRNGRFFNDSHIGTILLQHTKPFQ